MVIGWFGKILNAFTVSFKEYHQQHTFKLICCCIPIAKMGINKFRWLRENRKNDKYVTFLKT